MPAKANRRMPDELLSILTRFHREVLRPDIERIVASAVETGQSQLRQEMQAAFDALAQRLDHLTTEYHMLVAGLKRVEERLDRIETRLERMALKSELDELKARVDGLQAQIRVLEERLSA